MPPLLEVQNLQTHFGTLDGVVRELSAKLDASERRVERLEGRIDSPPPDEDGQMPSWA